MVEDQGDLPGIQCSGNQMNITGLTIHRVEGGKIVEEWEMLDNLGLMQQIGAIPPPEQAETYPEISLEPGKTDLPGSRRTNRERSST